ncbi:GlxA family transcriptional regulator [Pseudomonas vanderleydeniana]|uniref:Helix-turn-helix domain-containing protein n=1 Tax=Pseudomonas vanderleydeniana TaxID=2745495 RepID=A0A9E6PHM4_9PSED|nr:helix-turn-helix domain-containing protein [Pseudomonas vanderleydeniana]QXI26395.1 helix-turn-helix domain-containing protein [Pseudomonas vanderleydeniana]
MKIDILALDGVFDTGLAALMDTLSTANELAQAHTPDGRVFDVRLIGVRKRVRTAQGFTATVEAPEPGRTPDWVVVPAVNAKPPERLVQALGRRDVRDARERLRNWHESGVGIAAACLGTFILAEAGLLDGREATTTWSMAPLFRQWYPRVRLDDSRMVVASRGIVTAGAAMGHLDLALWLVRQASPELASQVARFLLIDTRSSQAQYIIPDHLAHSDPLIERFERWARTHLAAGFSLQGAAEALHVHPRTLQRRTEAILGKSPLAFFQDLRVEQAKHLVATGHDLEVIAEKVGYSDAATLRNLLRRKLGRGVRELRSELG